uniref:E3 ubiquitin-protein ligase listerin n=1 Tax=Chaetoceros debilis TaxID=122233 RepID=A0A7S3Q3Y5_9STRA
MGKEKRNADSSSKFTGFSAFASHTSAASTAVQLSHVKTSKLAERDTVASRSKLRPMPLFTGKNSELIQTFKRISKKDYITKTRAVSDISSYAYPCNADGEPCDSTISKPEQIAAFSHFFFLFRNKLIHDNNPSVRIGAMNVVASAMAHIPKACNILFRLDAENEREIGAIGNVIGWIYSSQSSQINEEAKIASRTWEALCSLLKDCDERPIEPLVKKCIVEHVESILQFSSRASNLAAALSVKRKDSQQKNNDNGKKGGELRSKISTLSMSESDKEEMEERFDRVLLVTLRAMECIIQEFPETKSNSNLKEHADGDTAEGFYHLFSNKSILWKHLNSGRAIFRRATFALVSRIAQDAVSLIHQTEVNLSSLLLNVLSSERDPANFVAMFEMILLFISSFRPHGISMAWETSKDHNSMKCCPGINVDGFMKSFAKVLRRACYGSPSNFWAPIMLPILALLPSSQHQLQFLNSLSNGKIAAVGTADTIAIVSAAAECSMYLLICTNKSDERKVEDEDVYKDSAQDISQTFLDSLSFYLSVSEGSTALFAAKEHLASVLSRGLFKLNNLSIDRNRCLFLEVRDWFWDKGIITALNATEDFELSGSRKITKLVRWMTSEKSRKEVDRVVLDDAMSFESTLRSFFWQSMLPVCQDSPSLEVLLLLQSIFYFTGIQHVFDSQHETKMISSTSCEAFCREVIIPLLSKPATSSKGKTWVTTMFNFFFFILNEIKDNINIGSIWEYYIDEVSSGSDLHTLFLGVSVLTSEWEELIESLHCHAFDQLATTVANDTEDRIQNPNDTNQIQDTESSFLRLCVGLDSSKKLMLVSSNVIQPWKDLTISSAYDYGYQGVCQRHVLLEVLFSLSEIHPSLIKPEDKMSLIKRAWYEGGASFYFVTSSVAFDESLCKNLVILGSTILKQQLNDEQDRGSIKANDIDSWCHRWAERASRLIELQQKYFAIAAAPLKTVGLEDLDVWRRAIEDGTESQQRDILFLCFVNLMKKIPIATRMDFFPVFSLLVHMLIVFAHDFKTERCDICLELFGGLDINRDAVISCLMPMVDFVSGRLESAEGSDDAVRCAVVVYDWLVGLILPKFIPNDVSQRSDDLEQTNISEGDIIWYVADTTRKNAPRVKATVKKVHRDDFPNLYFTIQFEESAKLTLKQTIASRLKKRQVDKNSALSNGVHEMTALLEERTITNVVKKYLDSPIDELKDVVAEILNISVSYFGFQGKQGIGTVRFQAIQAISKLDQEVITALSSENLDSIILERSLQSLSTALGHGILTVESHFNTSIMNYDGKSVLDALKRKVDGDDLSSFFRGIKSFSLCSAFITWIGVSVSSLMTIDNAAFLWELLDSLSSVLIEEDADGVASTCTNLLVMSRALKEMNRAMVSTKDVPKTETIASEQLCASNIIKLFIKSDTEQSSQQNSTEQVLPSWYLPLKDYIIAELEENSSVIQYGARTNTEGLLRSLNSPVKQWLAFHILQVSACSGCILFSIDQVELSEGTTNMLNFWQDGLVDEEAIEIEEDALNTAQWLPTDLMSFAESWDSTSGHNETIFIADLLRWYLCIDFLDSAGGANMQNRAHMTSYFGKTGAVTTLFELVLPFIQFKKHDRSSLFQCVSISSSESLTSNIESLCKTIMFRTIESMPTLCKMWWNDECPLALKSPVMKFVEAIVAPETLRRELNRMDKSSDLGEMVVRGNCISREISATYVQDECNISVMIRVPHSFPLRNVEVDCRKTLGVSEKRWRYWSLQIMRMLNGQDGSILDALLLWKQNVDKEFDGVEPCPVCYSVLCPKTHAMPNLECKTCNNRFHSSCLYKWFNSSGKNQCVLCQQPWSGTKVS